MNNGFNPITSASAKKHLTYEDGHVVKDHGDGTYDVMVGGRDFAYEIVRTNRTKTTIKKIQISDPVRICFPGGNKSLPIILLPGIGTSPNHHGSVISGGNGITDHGGNIIFPISSGLWIQSGGYWWQSYSSLTKQESLNIAPTIVTQTETFTPSGVTTTPPAGTFSLFTSSPGLFLYLGNLPSRQFNFKFTNITINGVSYFGGYDPYTQGPSLDGSGYFLGRLKYGGFANAQFNNPGLFLFNIPDTSIPSVGPTFATSAITSIVISYSFTTVTSTHLVTGTDQSGPGTAISLRGLCMFPDTKPVASQMVADLNYNYVSDGGEIIPTPVSEPVLYYPGAVGVPLSHIPIPGTITGSFNDFSFLADYVLYVQGQTLYALAQSQTAGYFANGPIVVTYGIGPSATFTETSTGGGEFTYNFLWTDAANTSGTTTITPPFGSSSVVSFVSATNLTNTFAGVDINNIVGNSFNLNANGVSVGDQIVLKYTASWILSAVHFKVATNYPIKTLISVIVDSVGDSLATFSGYYITLSSPPSNAGSIIVVNYTSAGNTLTTDTFTATQGQTAFQLSQVPTGGITVPNNSNPDSGFSLTGGNSAITASMTPALFAILDPTIPGLVRFALTHTADTNYSDTVNYVYNRVYGKLFHITSGIITERNLSGGTTYLSLPFPSSFDATPPSDFLASLGGKISSADGVRWQDGWDWQRWGFLFYDPISDSYTAITPVGIFWRSRIAGDISPANYVFTPWPIEAVSDDKILTGYSYPALVPYEAFPYVNGYEKGYPGASVDGFASVGTLCKTAPYMGVSVASKYALQGSWPAVGPGVFGSRGGAGGVPDYKLNFWLKSSSNTWEVQGQTSVKLLVNENLGTGKLYIPACGLIQKEAQGGYVTGGHRSNKYTYNENNLKNNSWPATRKTAAWIIGCSWGESEWGLDQSEKDTREAWNTKKFGLDDSGFTLNAVDMTGSIISQLTYKGSSEVLDGVSNFPDSVNFDIAHSSDQFLKPSSITYGESGGSWFIIDSAGLAVETFNYLKDYGYAWYYYILTGRDGPAKAPDLLKAGIPTLGDTVTKFASDNYGTVDGEDNYGSQCISMDSSDNIYITLKVPYWVRGLDGIRTQISEEMTGTYTVQGPFVSSYSFVGFDCPGYEGVPAITGIRDKNQNGSMLNSTPPPDEPKMSGRYSQGGSHPQGGFITPFETFMNKQVYFPVPDAESDNFVTGSDGVRHYVSTTYTFDGPLVAPWYQTIPNRKYTSFRTTHDFGDSGIHFYYRVGYGGIYAGTSPFRGAAIFNHIGDCRRTYTKSSRTFLKKIKFDGSKLSELWSLDISEINDVLSVQHWGPYPYTNANSSHVLSIPKDFLTYYTRACGRYIFVLRQIESSVVDAGYYGGVGKFTSLALDVYDNGNVKPEAERYRFYLPGGLIGPTPAQIILGEIIDPQMISEIDPNNQEFIVVEGTQYNPTTSTVMRQKWKITFPVDQSASPTFIYNNLGEENTPTVENWQGMASAGNDYIFTDKNASIIRQPGGG